jgi:hypothetical protein
VFIPPQLPEHFLATVPKEYGNTCLLCGSCSYGRSPHRVCALALRPQGGLTLDKARGPASVEGYSAAFDVSGGAQAAAGSSDKQRRAQAVSGFRRGVGARLRAPGVLPQTASAYHPPA